MKRLLTILCAAMISIAAMASTMVVVDGVHVRLRYSPSLSGTIVTNYNGKPVYPSKGASFTYLGTSGNFYKIQYGSSEVFISRDYCHLKQSGGYSSSYNNSGYSQSSNHSTVVVVDGVHVRLRQSPSLSGRIYTGSNGKPIYPYKGQTLPYLGTSGNFYIVSYYGTTLYISRDYSHIKTR